MEVGYLLWLVLFLQILTAFTLVSGAVTIAFARGWDATMRGREDGRATFAQWLMACGLMLFLLAVPELILIAAALIGELIRRAGM